MDLAATPLPYDLYVAADLFLSDRARRGRGARAPRHRAGPMAALARAYFLLPLGDAHVGGVAALWPHTCRARRSPPPSPARAGAFPRQRSSLPEIARGIRALTLPKPRVGPLSPTSTGRRRTCATTWSPTSCTTAATAPTCTSPANGSSIAAARRSTSTRPPSVTSAAAGSPTAGKSSARASGVAPLNATGGRWKAPTRRRSRPSTTVTPGTPPRPGTSRASASARAAPPPSRSCRHCGW